MFKEYESLKQTEANIDTKISELTKELEKTKSEHTKAAAAYRKMMVDDASGTVKHDTAELTEAKMKVDKLTVKIEVTQERLQMVSDGKLDQLKALLDDVHKGWQREADKLSEEVNTIFASAREYRAKLTLEIQKGHDKYLQARELLTALNQAERMVGITDYSRQTTRLGVPEKPLTTEFYSIGVSLVTDKCVIPSEDEIEKAYQRGELPEWINHYAETGELVTNEDLRNRAARPAQVAAQGAAKGFLGRVLGKSQ